jgi:hypothetical protein
MPGIGNYVGFHIMTKYYGHLLILHTCVWDTKHCAANKNYHPKAKNTARLFKSTVDINISHRFKYVENIWQKRNYNDAALARRGSDMQWSLRTPEEQKILANQ